MKLKIYSTDSRVDSFDVYANGVFKANVPITYPISTTVTNGSSSGDTSISKGGTAYVTLSAETGYNLPSSITVTGATYTYDSSTGVVSLSAPTGDVSIAAECASSGYDVRIQGSLDSSGKIEIYDGQDAYGTLLWERDNEWAYPFDMTVRCTSGYIYITSNDIEGTAEGTCSAGITSQYVSGTNGYLYTVTADGSITGVEIYGCLAKGTQIMLADGTTKNIENITFDDKLLVYDFYTGKVASAKPSYLLPLHTASEYREVTLSNGIVLKMVGKHGHRMFNLDKQSFEYPENFEEGDRTLLQNGETATIVSIKLKRESVEYSNIITDKHYNLFANGILTSCRLSNRYGIENMKYTDEEKMTEAEVSDYIDKLEFKGFKGVE